MAEEAPSTQGKTLSDVSLEPAPADPFKGGRAKKALVASVVLLAVATIVFRVPIARKLTAIRSEFASGMDRYASVKPAPPVLPNTSSSGDFAMLAVLPRAVAEPPEASRPPAAAGAPAPPASARPAIGPTSAPAPKLTKPPQPPGQPAPGHTKVFGAVYDMRSRVVVPGAALTFKGPGGLTLGTTTDERGLYQIDIPWVSFDGGVTVGVEAPGYRPGGLEDGDPPWFERSAADVEAAMQELAPSDLEPALVRALSRAEYRALDLVVLPP